MYTARPSSEEPRPVYLDALDGLWELRFPYRDVDDVWAVYHEWGQPWLVHDRVLKKNAKDLGPRRFEPVERKKFEDSDKAEWEQWIKNKV